MKSLLIAGTLLISIPWLAMDASITGSPSSTPGDISYQDTGRYKNQRKNNNATRPGDDTAYMPKKNRNNRDSVPHQHRDTFPGDTDNNKDPFINPK